MLFNSYVFLFQFLPIVFLLFRALHRFRTAAFLMIIFASLYFYAYWNSDLLYVIISSIALNYGLVKLLRARPRKWLLVIGIAVNLGILGYYKYAGFFVETISDLFGLGLNIPNIMLPLAISFFTFQQVAYLVDTYRGETEGHSFLEYVWFIVFFPQLIAGPIVRHQEMFHQFRDKALLRLNMENIEKGLTIFFIGLFKKTVIADTLAHWVNDGFSQSAQLNVVDGWITALAYTFQLYFDFSGYCDMAIGLALLFNIRLPINFDSPYKALNIQQFWQKWHMTLNRFLTHYVYIPLGGSRTGKKRTYLNIMIVFLISGLWHGAGWTFIFWGFLHGAASVICRMWKQLGLKMPRALAWGLTFLFVVCAWVFFRAGSMEEAWNVLSAMARIDQLTFALIWQNKYILFGLFLLLLVVLFARNSIAIMNDHHAGWRRTLFVASLAAVAILHLDQVSEFIYFNF
jgi:Predicted membrane protein involved in D-alanine export